MKTVLLQNQIISVAPSDCTLNKKKALNRSHKMISYRKTGNTGFAFHKTTCFELKIFPLQAPNRSFPCPSFQQHTCPSQPGKEHSLRRHQRIPHPSRRSGSRHPPLWMCHTGRDAKCRSRIHPRCPRAAWSCTAS